MADLVYSPGPQFLGRGWSSAIYNQSSWDRFLLVRPGAARAISCLWYLDVLPEFWPEIAIFTR